MVDRIQRDIASRVLQNFIDGVITNDEFEARFPRSDRDPALSAIKANAWILYSDLYRHSLTGKHELSAETRALLQRCIVFLGTELEFQWPVPGIRVSNIFTNLCARTSSWIGLSRVREDPQLASGEEDVWPFFRRQDYSAHVDPRPEG